MAKGKQGKVEKMSDLEIIAKAVEERDALEGQVKELSARVGELSGELDRYRILEPLLNVDAIMTEIKELKRWHRDVDIHGTGDVRVELDQMYPYRVCIQGPPALLPMRGPCAEALGEALIEAHAKLTALRKRAEDLFAYRSFVEPFMREMKDVEALTD